MPCRRMLFAIGAIMTAALNAACQNESTPSNCICTTLFASVAVTVTDTLGAPVTGLNPSITVARTGKAIVPVVAPPTGSGGYNVVTDEEIGQFNPAGDTLRFVATSGLRIAAAQFAVSAPGVCHCHVQKDAGPDTIVLR